MHTENKRVRVQATTEKNANSVSLMLICSFSFGDGISNWIFLCMLQILQADNTLHSKVIYTYSTESPFLYQRV